MLTKVSVYKPCIYLDEIKVSANACLLADRGQVLRFSTLLVLPTQLRICIQKFKDSFKIVFVSS